MRKVLDIVLYALFFVCVVGIIAFSYSPDIDNGANVSVMNTPAEFRIRDFNVNSKGDVAIAFNGPERLKEILVFDEDGQLLQTHTVEIDGSYVFKLEEDKSIIIMGYRSEKKWHYNAARELISMTDYDTNEDAFFAQFDELNNWDWIKGNDDIKYEKMRYAFEDAIVAKKGSETFDIYRTPKAIVGQRMKARNMQLLAIVGAVIIGLIWLLVRLLRPIKYTFKIADYRMRQKSSLINDNDLYDNNSIKKL